MSEEEEEEEGRESDHCDLTSTHEIAWDYWSR